MHAANFKPKLLTIYLAYERVSGNISVQDPYFYVNECKKYF